MPEQQFRTSFIPKKPQMPITKRHGSSVSIFFLIGLIVFLGSVALSVGVFFYREYTKSAIVEKSKMLEDARSAFDETLIKELIRIDARIDGAQTILDKHTALTALFNLLEATTLKSVQFTVFSLIASEGTFSIQMRGIARSFSSVALQSDIFGRNQFIQGPVFSNLDVDDFGNATFSLHATLDPALVSYRGAQESSQ